MLVFVAGAQGMPLLASSGGGKTVRVWDLAAGTLAMTLRRRSIVRSLDASGSAMAIGDEECVSVIGAS